MSRGYILARVSLRWAFKGLVLIAALVAAAWCGGYVVSLLLG